MHMLDKLTAHARRDGVSIKAKTTTPAGTTFEVRRGRVYLGFVLLHPDDNGTVSDFGDAEGQPEMWVEQTLDLINLSNAA